MKLGDAWGRGAWVAILLPLACAALGLSSGCKAAPRQRPIEMGPVDTGPGSLTAARKFLEGRWTLESFDVHPSGGAPVTLKGAGTLVYDEAGNLRMEIRADKESTDLLRTRGVDIGDGVISTDGRTVIDLQNRTLTYVLEGQPPPVYGPFSMSRPRHWVVEGDTLTLTTKDEAGKTLSVGRWKKSQPAGTQ